MGCCCQKVKRNLTHRCVCDCGRDTPTSLNYYWLLQLCGITDGDCQNCEDSPNNAYTGTQPHNFGGADESAPFTARTHTGYNRVHALVPKQQGFEGQYSQCAWISTWGSPRTGDGCTPEVTTERALLLVVCFDTDTQLRTWTLYAGATFVSTVGGTFNVDADNYIAQYEYTSEPEEDCAEPKTLTYVGDNGTCANWPETIDIYPNDTAPFLASCGGFCDPSAGCGPDAYTSEPLPIYRSDASPDTSSVCQTVAGVQTLCWEPCKWTNGIPFESYGHVGLYPPFRFPGAGNKLNLVFRVAGPAADRLIIYEADGNEWRCDEPIVFTPHPSSGPPNPPESPFVECLGWPETITVTPTGTCPLPTGACCLPDGTCTNGLTRPQCAIQGGAWQGPDSDCGTVNCETDSATGACCNADFSCTGDQTQAECEAAGGTWQGADTACADVTCEPPATGACCYGDGTCDDDMTEAACTGAGGYWQGENSVCSSGDCTNLAPCCKVTGDSYSCDPGALYREGDCPSPNVWLDPEQTCDDCPEGPCSGTCTYEWDADTYEWTAIGDTCTNCTGTTCCQPDRCGEYDGEIVESACASDLTCGDAPADCECADCGMTWQWNPNVGDGVWMPLDNSCFDCGCQIDDDSAPTEPGEPFEVRPGRCESIP